MLEWKGREERGGDKRREERGGDNLHITLVQYFAIAIVAKRNFLSCLVEDVH